MACIMCCGETYLTFSIVLSNASLSLLSACGDKKLAIDGVSVEAALARLFRS